MNRNYYKRLLHLKILYPNKLINLKHSHLEKFDGVSPKELHLERILQLARMRITHDTYHISLSELLSMNYAIFTKLEKIIKEQEEEEAKYLAKVENDLKQPKKENK